MITTFGSACNPSQTKRREKMKTVTRIETRTEKVQFGFYDIEEEKFIPINVAKAADMKLAIKKLECSETLIDTIGIAIEMLIEAVSCDLKDIWDRLDNG